MKITNVRLSAVPISRYAPELDVPPALDTTMVVLLTDRRIGGEPLVGYGFTSIGRFAQWDELYIRSGTRRGAGSLGLRRWLALEGIDP